MSWSKVFDLPCGCVRHPQKSKKASVLIQRWEDVCETHRATRTPPGEESSVQKQMRQEQKIQERMRELAILDLQAKGEL
jgi:hypothetical protein